MLDLGGPALVWLALAIVFGIVEILLPHFGLMFAAIGAGAAAAAAAFDVGAVGQVIVFTVALVGSLAVLRPMLMANLRSRKGVPSRTDVLVGHDAVVTHEIDPTLGPGRINVGGQDWAARSTTTLAVGTRVKVVGADGIVLEVTPS